MIQSIQDYENWRDSLYDRPENTPDEQVSMTFSHDYPNDTVLEYSRSGKDSTLRLSFTSEDPDAGSEELIYHGENGESMQELVNDLKSEIKTYLDYRDSSSFIRQQGLQDEIHSMEDLYGEYTSTALYAFECMLNHLYAEQTLTVPWHPIETEKQDMLYSCSHRQEIESGCVGHLRGDFGRDGDEFWTSWFDHQSHLKSKDFRDELQTVVNALREPKGLLDGFSAMNRKCVSGQKVDDSFGFRAESENYEYCLRCIPRRGDYNFYLYCYDKAVLRQQQRTKQQTLSPDKEKKNKEFER